MRRFSTSTRQSKRSLLSNHLVIRSDWIECLVATLALSLLLSASWSYRLRLAQWTQRRLLDQLWASIACASITFYNPHPQSIRNMFHGLLFCCCCFPTGIHKFNCFEKTDVASMDWSCYFPFVSTALISGYTNWKWPNGIAVVPTRCCTSWRVYCIAFSMFSPTRISTRSCSYGFSMCEIKSQELADSPPKMCAIGAKKTLSRLYSQVSIQAPLFGWNQVLF